MDTEKMIIEEEAQLRASDADLIEESFEGEREGKITMCPYSGSSVSDVSDFVPLSINTGWRGPRGHNPSEGTIAIMETISLSDLQKMTDLFYEKAFQDEALDKFIQSHDDPHGSRFAKWIHQKLSGSTLWDQDRAVRLRNNEGVTLANGHTGFVVHDRSSAHVAAWNSPKRHIRESGRHFKLEECRVWMRIHFWAMRESGLMEKSPSFADYYVRFIAHFVRVYESTAPLFARDSFRWSASPKNIDDYIHRYGRRMTEVIGMDFETAISQLPPSEANDIEWPYNLTPTSTTDDY
jgi:hypothetical protein